MTRHLFRFAGLLVLVIALSPAAAGQEIAPYYLRQLEQGQNLYEAGDYTGAVEYLERAAFGLMERPSRFVEAQLLLALSEQGRGNFPEARTAIGQVLRADAISGVYPPSGVDPAIIATFESAVRRLLPEAELPVPGAPRPAERPPEAAVATRPADEEGVEASLDQSELRSLEETVERIAILTRQLRTTPRDVGTRLELAESYLEVGQIDQADELAESILSLEPSNREARLVRATVAARQNRCGEAIEIFTGLEALAPLSAADLGTLFVCLVREGEIEAARSRLDSLSPEVRGRPDVQAALEEFGAIDHDRSE